MKYTIKENRCFGKKLWAFCQASEQWNQKSAEMFKTCTSYMC